MDELQALREFRSDIPGADAEARSRALAQLLARIEPPRRRRTRARVVVLVAAALAAAAALLIGRDRKIDPVDRALAAVAAGPILHAVLEVPVQELIEAPEPVHQTVLDLSSGAERPVIARTELWYDARRRRLHQIESVNGAVLLDALETRRGTVDSAGGSDSEAPTIDPGLGAFFEGFNRALADESVTVARSGVIEGRRVQWLRFPAAPGRHAQEVAIDARTYKPLLLRQLCAGCADQPTYRIVALSGIRAAEADFSPPVRHDLHLVGRTKTAVANVTPRRAASALGRPAIWPGRTVGGLRLTSVRLSRVTARLAEPGAQTARSVRRRGLTFFYGGKPNRRGRVRVRPGQAYASVAESAGGGLRFEGFNLDVVNGAVVTSLGGAALPPPGSAVVTWSKGGPWRVQLRAGGLYVEIESSSRALGVAAARALAPLE